MDGIATVAISVAAASIPLERVSEIALDVTKLPTASPNESASMVPRRFDEV
jgi:hypothetical protein